MHHTPALSAVTRAACVALLRAYTGERFSCVTMRHVTERLDEAIINAYAFATPRRQAVLRHNDAHDLFARYVHFVQRAANPIERVTQRTTSMQS